VRQIIDFLGVNVDALDTQGLYARILDFVRERKPRKVMYLNADCALLARKDEHYRRILNNADLVYADGISIVYGARLLGRHLPGRSTGADFIPRFGVGFAENNIRLFLLGARPGVAEKAAANLLQVAPSLSIVGAHHGYFRKEETGQVIRKIQEAHPDILLVGLGAPYQEKWIDEHLVQLNTPVVWGVGGAFDFISGRTPRGPKWLVDHGFEWLCRLFAEPRRLWRRYLIGNIEFLWRVLLYKFSIGGAK
jgi:N-acetylglucosaminyldiphosphoundecaprenol N-acetyl-beta-D-mannosaminyltransferase